MKIDDVIAKLPIVSSPLLPAPRFYQYAGPKAKTNKIMLAVESMKRHTTDEGWQIAAGLDVAGYELCGHNLPTNMTDVPAILYKHQPGTVVVQDKREWDVAPRDFRDKQARFINTELLAENPEIFRVTILKDAHQRPEYHRQAASEIGTHAWIVYYHPRIVKHLAPYVRSEHLIRTYHTIDKMLVPRFDGDWSRSGCLLSGALSGAYPLRQHLVHNVHALPETVYLPHPGYHMNGCATPAFLHLLSKYKIAICTASMYGYALRKIIEATACGCKVLTDLPVDDELPEIDGNLTRIDPTTPFSQICFTLRRMLTDYNPREQEYWSFKACSFYDFRDMGQRLAIDIERMRQDYATPATS